jgi:hypothetical protein
MNKTHENKMMIWTAIFSTVVSMLVIALGFWYGNKLNNRIDESVPMSRVETPESKLMMVAMRCHKMEQDNDMLRLRIEELEDTIAEITNKESEVCGQYWLYQDEKPTNIVEQLKVKNVLPLAVDDLIPTNSL